MKLQTIIFLLLASTSSLNCTTTVPLVGNDGTTQTVFPVPINAKTYNRATGTLYVGLATGGGNFAISQATRPVSGVTQFKSMVTLFEQGVFSNGIEFLTLAGNLGQTNANLAVVVQRNSGILQQQVVSILSNNGSTFNSSSVLFDASGSMNVNGLPTSGVVGIAANRNFIFPAVRSNRGNFGQNCSSGIASVAIDQSDLSLTQLPAVVGDSGIKAKQLDSTTLQTYITDSATINPTSFNNPNFVELYWDEPLQRLYIGLQMITAGNTAPAPGQTCVAGTGATAPYGVTCPDAYTYDPASNTCVLTPTGLTCPSGMIFDRTGMTCVTAPTGPTGTTGTFVCPTGYTCILLPTGPFGVSCPAGFQFDLASNTCVATGGVCPPGQTISPISGTCIPVFGGLGYNGPAGINQDVIEPVKLMHRSPTSGGKSVVVARVNSSGAIEFSNIAPDPAFTINSLNMVGIYDTTQQPLTIKKIRVMHASTGPSYLIINGGNGTPTTTGNLLYALPLVDDPTNAATNGTLADKNSALTNYKFTVPAAANADLPLSTEAPVMIGAAPINTNPATTISDMEVIGDTVYVSVINSGNANNGIFYSQAQFDAQGKIATWTPWTKRLFPPDGFNGTAIPNGVSFFEVDAVTDVTWAVDSLTNRSVVITSWEKPNGNGTLPGQINTQITDSAMAALDLDQSTLGFTGVGSTPERYALFAGNGKVVFTRVSRANITPANSNTTQTDTTDFTLPTNFRTTNLPRSSCIVSVLEYSRQLPGTASNYFFAGAQDGLYAFAQTGTGNGFDVSTLSTLDLPPFSTGSWQKIAAITGQITDIKTTGNALYVLTYTTSALTPLQSTLYRIPFTTNLATMFAPGNIFTIAQTGSGVFSNVSTFTGIQIISTNPTGTQEQIVLATNNGLFQSLAAGGVQTALDETTANWSLISDAAYYNGIGYIDNASITISPPSTVWPFSIRDQFAQKTFTRSLLQQLNGNTNSTFAFIPPAPLYFNSNATTNAQFATIPLITYFWSDGARRIMVNPDIDNFCTPFELLSFPFNTIEWNISNPNNALLDVPTLNTALTFYWVKQIGVTGVLLVGTDHGVIALQ